MVEPGLPVVGMISTRCWATQRLISSSTVSMMKRGARRCESLRKWATSTVQNLRCTMALEWNMRTVRQGCTGGGRRER